MRSWGFYAEHEKPLVDIRSKGRQGTRGEERHEDENTDVRKTITQNQCWVSYFGSSYLLKQNIS